MYAWVGLGFLTSPVGHPIRLHPETELCSNFEEAKVFVEVNLSKELPKSYCFKLGQDLDVTVEYSYPWLPPRCNRCGKWGHQEEVCVIEKVTPIEKVTTTKETAIELEEGEVDVASDDVQDVQSNNSTTLVEIAAPVCEQLQTIPSEQSASRDIAVEIVVSSDQEGWSLVSPGKGCRSGGKSQPGLDPDIFLDPSRFSVLQEEECSQDKQVEDITTVDQNQLLAAKQQEVSTGKQNTQMETEKSSLRATLPRSSKDAHKVLSRTSTQKAKDTLPSTSSRRISTKNH